MEMIYKLNQDICPNSLKIFKDFLYERSCNYERLMIKKNQNKPQTKTKEKIFKLPNNFQLFFQDD